MTEVEKNEKAAASEEAWAKPVAKLTVEEMPEEVMNLNVDGRQVVGPLQGFGALWQKTYKLRLNDNSVSPQEVVKTWKEKLPEFMPDNSRFYPSLTGVAPGEVVLINATLPGIPGGMPVSTGVMILYADDVSFTVMTPEGHPESGFNTFSAYEEDGATVAQIQSLARANDPVFELGFRYMGGSGQQERIWHHVLGQLAAEFGSAGEIQMEKKCVDSRIQWSQAKNVWHNAVIRTTLNTPVRWAKRIVKR
jgi:hypothetical protein